MEMAQIKEAVQYQDIIFIGMIMDLQEKVGSI